MALDPVRWSPDLERILALPRRVISEQENETWVKQLNDLLLTDYGRECGQSLRPLQARALVEAAHYRGLVASLAVGAGKTLISWLLPLVCDAQRPLLLLPANLRDNKTPQDFGQIQKHWKHGRPYRIESYTALSLVQGADLLDRYQPDLIVCDEVQKLKNPRSSMSKRIHRYVHARRKQGAPLVLAIMTGTLVRASILDIAHFLEWVFGTGSPTPLAYFERQAWAGALDETSDPFEVREIGALERLWTPGVDEHETDLTRTRKAFQRRLHETPGVVCWDSTSCDLPLSIEFLVPPPCPEIEKAFETFRTVWETPGGDQVSDSLSAFRLGGQLALGYYSRWDPAPPESWVKKYKAKCKFVRETIKTSHLRKMPLDTEAQVFRTFPDHPAVLEWQEIRNTFKPNSKPQWFSASVLEFIRQWLATQEPTLVWVRHIPVGQALADWCGLEYYGQGGETADGRSIEQANPRNSLVLSLGANLEGRNLQAWHQNLITSPTKSSKDWEQKLGRTHRSNQKHPVRNFVLLSSVEAVDALDQAIREAQFVHETLGHTQKLLTANFKPLPSLPKNLRYQIP